MDDERGQRALGFGKTAGLYDKFRPSYPHELIGDVVSALPRVHDVVEIGTGTGKATRLLAERGLSVVGVEPDAAMAAVARRNLHQFSNVSIDVCRFEEWNSPSARADVVAAAQCWHWLDHEVALPKTREVLRRPGALAIFSNIPRPDETELRRELDAVYRLRAPDLAEQSVMTRWFGGLAEAETWKQELLDHGFGPVEVRTYDWTRRYRTAEYLSLLETHSDHHALAADDRRALLAGIAAVIDRNGGSFTFAYRGWLMLARVHDRDP